MELIIIYMSLALIISGMCSILEATILSTPMSYITSLEAGEEGKNRAKAVARLKQLKHNIDRPISAILIINTIANTIGASLVGNQAALVAEQYNCENDVFIGIVSGVFTLLILIFAEIFPKTIGSTYWRKLALPAAAIIRFLIVITYPLVYIFEHFTKAVSKGGQTATVSREEVSALANVGAEEGVLENKENNMIQNLLKLADVTAHEIMTPSTVVTMADSSLTLSEFYKTSEFDKYSRIPIYSEDDDDYVVGYVLRQTILEYLASDRFDVKLKDIARPILSFQETDSVVFIWEKLLEKKEHISIIIDEYGSLRGIVTMEDVIETMFGVEIVDETDEVVDMQEYARAQWKQMQKQQIKN